MSFTLTRPQPDLTEHYGSWETFASNTSKGARSMCAVARLLDVMVEAELIDHSTAYRILTGVSPETMGLELTSPSKLV